MNSIAAGERVAARHPYSATPYHQTSAIQKRHRGRKLASLFACLYPLLMVCGATANASQALPRTGLIMHLDSTLGVQITNQNISYWWDQSGTGRDLRAAGSPALVFTGPAGLPVIELDSPSDTLNQISLATLPTLDNNRTLIVLSSATDSEATVGYGAKGCGASFGLDQSLDGASSLTQGCASGNLYSKGMSTPGTWNLHILLVRAGSFFHLRNGELVDGRTPALATQTGPFGIQTIPHSAAGKLQLATILAYDRALGSTELDQVQRYLGSKWFGNAYRYQTAPDLAQLDLPRPHIELRQASNADQQLEISWRASFADSCQSDTGWSSSSATAGSVLVDGSGPGRSYGLNCWHRTASASSHISTTTKPVQITWQTPPGQENVTVGYRLFVGRASRRYDSAVPVAANVTNSHQFELTPGRYFVAMSTIGHDGHESSLSGEIVITVD